MVQIESFFLYTKNQLTKKLLYNKNSLINNDNRNTFVKLKKAPKGQKKRTGSVLFSHSVLSSPL